MHDKGLQLPRRASPPAAAPPQLLNPPLQGTPGLRQAAGLLAAGCGNVGAE